MAGKTTTIATAVVKLAADSASYSAGVDKVRKQNRSLLSEMQSNFGRSSPFAQVLKGLQGGGILLGLGLAGKEFESFTGKIAEFTDGIRTGQKSTSELVGDLARGVPIIGEFAKGFDNIGEALSGAKVAIDQITQGTRLNDALTKLMGEKRDFSKSMGEKMDAITRPGQESSMLLPLTGSTKGFQEIQLQAKGDVQKILNTYEDGKKELAKLTGEYASLSASMGTRPEFVDKLKNPLVLGRMLLGGPNNKTTVMHDAVVDFNKDLQAWQNNINALGRLKKQIAEMRGVPEKVKGEAMNKLLGKPDFDIDLKDLQRGDYFLKPSFGNNLDKYLFPNGSLLNAGLGENFTKMVSEGFSYAKLKADSYAGQLGGTIAKWFGFGPGEESPIDVEMGERVKALHESLKSPVDKFSDQQRELQELLRNKRISPDDARFASAMALQDLLRQSAQSVQYAPAIEARTMRFPIAAAATPADAIRQAVQQSQQNHERLMQVLTQVSEYMRNHGIPVVEINN